MTIANAKENESVTWAQLVELEPRLGALYKEIRKVKDDKTEPSFCANAVWYGYGKYERGGFRRMVKNLVGYSTEPKQKDARLRSMEAHDIAYQKLYSALPGCRNCNCA